MNYQLSYTNYIENDIFETAEPANNKDIFETFTQAKNKLLWVLRMEKTEIDARIKEVKKLRKNQFDFDN